MRDWSDTNTDATGDKKSPYYVTDTSTFICENTVNMTNKELEEEWDRRKEYWPFLEP